LIPAYQDQKSEPASSAPSRVFRPAPLGQRAACSWHSSGTSERIPEQDLDLRVHTAQFVRGPAGDRVMNGRIDPQKYLFSLSSHG